MHPDGIIGKQRKKDRKKALTLAESNIAELIGRIAPNFDIKEVVLFGSYARGDANEASDVDLAIWADEGFSLFDAASFRRTVAEGLGVEVDLLSLKSLSGALLGNIQEEGVLLYERAV